MDNIQQSSNKIKKMYENLTYLDQYGGQVLLFIILTLIVFLVYSYCAIMLNVQPIKDDWVNQRCKPSVMPFAGFINKPDGKTISEFTQENFTYCIQNILKSITGDAVQPLTYTTTLLQNLYLGLMKNIQSSREMINNVRNSMGDVAKEIMGRFLNIMTPLQQIIIGMKDAMGKIQGILTAGLYTSLSGYYALKSLLGAIVEFIVIILLVLVSIIVVLWIVPFTWPFAAANSAIFLAIAIPLTIIVVFLTQVLGIHTTAVPQLKCFDKNTQIELDNGEKVDISNIIIGDVLAGGSIVTGKMTVDASDLDMYNLNDVLVSGCHVVKCENAWIPVSEHPMSKKIKNYKKPYVFCLNTTEKTIIINDIVFTDWDEIYDESLLKKKEFICQKYYASEPNAKSEEIQNEEIHKYLDGGFYENTIIRLKNRTIKRIKEVRIDDILENGERVYAIVAIDGKNVKEQVVVNLGPNKYFVGGPNIHFIDENLGQTSIFEVNSVYKTTRKNPATKLYHLVTDKGTFKLGDLIINDYNSCIDFANV